MKKIYRIRSKNNLNRTLAIGLLASQNKTEYTFELTSKTVTFLKSEVLLEDLWEKGTDLYELTVRNDQNERIQVTLPLSCFGGCG